MTETIHGSIWVLYMALTGIIPREPGRRRPLAYPSRPLFQKWMVISYTPPKNRQKESTSEEMPCISLIPCLYLRNILPISFPLASSSTSLSR